MSMRMYGITNINKKDLQCGSKNDPGRRYLISVRQCNNWHCDLYRHFYTSAEVSHIKGSKANATVLKSDPGVLKNVSFHDKIK
jgi:hypothetical protein